MLRELLDTIARLRRLQRRVRQEQAIRDAIADEACRRRILDVQASTAREILERQAQLARDTVVQFPARRRRPF